MKLTEYVKKSAPEWGRSQRNRSKQWDIMIAAIEKNPEAKMRELAIILGWSEGKTKAIYHRMKQAGLIKKLHLVEK